MKVTFDYSPDHDWVAVYIDGKLVQSGHSVLEEELVRSLGHEVVVRHVDEDDLPGPM